MNQSTRKAQRRQGKGGAGGDRGKCKPKATPHLIPQPERARVLGSQSCWFWAHMVPGDWHCICSAPPTRRRAILEPNKDQPPQRLAKTAGGGAGRWAGLGSITQELGDPLGEERLAGKAAAAAAGEDWPRPQTRQLSGQFPGRQPPFWPPRSPKSTLLVSGPVFLSHL